MDIFDRFSAALATLHREGPGQPVDQFHDWALDTVKSVVSFDSGFWGSGTWLPDQAAASLHNVHLHNLPEAMTTDWETVKHSPEDQSLVRRAVEAGGRSVYFGAAELGRHPLYPEYGVHQIITRYLLEPDSGLFDVVSFYRSADQPPFDERDRQLHQAVVPHLLDVERKVRLRHLNWQCARCDVSQANRQAICDTRGLLRLAQPGMVRALRTEWPDWQGPCLPDALLLGLKRTPGREVVGERMVFSAMRQHDTILLSARERGPLDLLSEREKTVARHWRNGCGHKEIAVKMGISPATVRNHLTRIYGKLAVTSRQQLARTLGAMF